MGNIEEIQGEIELVVYGKLDGYFFDCEALNIRGFNLRTKSRKVANKRAIDEVTKEIAFLVHAKIETQDLLESLGAGGGS